MTALGFHLKLVQRARLEDDARWKALIGEAEFVHVTTAGCYRQT
jgi:hypothetical protein